MCIELINYSSRLPWRSFQIGQTTKRKSKAMIGTHGEGLSAACVVLNRNDCNVTATCDHFTAKIVDLQNNIYFQLARRSAVEDTVKFKIVLPPPRNLVNVDELMTTIRLPSAVSSVRSERGQLLTAPEHRGKQYNRGIYVSEDAKCLFGYNFLDPDKNLLQSRDRNSHTGDACLRECGSILFEAILRSEEVCQSVLACFVYADRPGAGGAASVQVYSDLGNGDHLTPAALQRLRSVHERSSLGDRPAIFCGNDTFLIAQISEARDMAVVYCHAVLHNYQEVTRTFFQQLQDAACALPAGSRLAQQQGAICALLRVEEVRASALELPGKLLGFWRVDRVAFVTGAHHLGPDSGLTLSEENEVNVHETLRAGGVSLRITVQVIRVVNAALNPALTGPHKATTDVTPAVEGAGGEPSTRRGGSGSLVGNVDSGEEPSPVTSDANSSADGSDGPASSDTSSDAISESSSEEEDDDDDDSDWCEDSSTELSRAPAGSTTVATRRSQRQYGTRQEGTDAIQANRCVALGEEHAVPQPVPVAEAAQLGARQGEGDEDRPAADQKAIVPPTTSPSSMSSTIEMAAGTTTPLSQDHDQGAEQDQESQEKCQEGSQTQDSWIDGGGDGFDDGDDSDWDDASEAVPAAASPSAGVPAEDTAPSATGSSDPASAAVHLHDGAFIACSAAGERVGTDVGGAGADGLTNMELFAMLFNMMLHVATQTIQDATPTPAHNSSREASAVATPAGMRRPAEQAAADVDDVGPSWDNSCSDAHRSLNR